MRSESSSRIAIASFLLVVAAGIAQASMTRVAGRPADIVLLVGILAGAAASLACFLIALTAFLLTRAPRKDVRRALRLQSGQHAFNHAIWDRFDLSARLLRMLVVRDALQPIESEISRLESGMVDGGSIAASLPAWFEAANAWYDTASGAFPEIPDRVPEPDRETIAEARASLPFGRNLSSVDLRATLRYRAMATRLEADRRLIARQSANLLPDLAKKLPPPPLREDAA